MSDEAQLAAHFSKLTLISSQLSEVVSQINQYEVQAGDGRTVTLLEMVRRVMSERRLLAELSQGDLFTNGPWNMMLDLYENAWLEKPISVSSLTIASGIPPTTALRYIAYLQDVKLLTKRGDSYDGRRVLVHLTKLGFNQVTEYLTRFARLWGTDIAFVKTPSVLA